MKAHTKETKGLITPINAINALKEGNTLCYKHYNTTRDILAQVQATFKGQFPFTTILHCIDSSVSAELIFD